MQSWIPAETATASFGDERLNERFPRLLDRMSQQPALKFPAACKGNAEAQAAYRFVNNDKVDPHKVFRPHRDATIERIRIRKPPVVLIPQDTTEVDVTRRHEVMKDAGPLNDPGRVGFFVHAMMALTPERLPLGVIEADFHARDPDEFVRSAAKDAATKRAERWAKPIEDKESVRWLEGYRAACRVAEEVPETTVVSLSDSEGDIFECLLEGRRVAGRRKAEWIIRACQDRALVCDDPSSGGAATSLRERLVAAPILDRLTIEVRKREPKSKDQRKRKQPRAARTAEVTVRAARVRLRGPARPGGKLADVDVNVVLVREEAPPPGEEPVEWILLTSLPINEVEEVLRVIGYYCCRWQIEIYFRILKSGCKVEESQLETAEAFLPYLSLCMIVAWRVQYVMMLGRDCPELPCDIAFDDDEWRAVYAVVKGETPPAEPPSMGTMVKMIASLGGYLGRKCDGEPGPKAMWVGLRRMSDLALAWRAHSAHVAGTGGKASGAKGRRISANGSTPQTNAPPDPPTCDKR
jgi:Transposase Tn5 dimerisation domain/Transposase DNA-binding